MIFLVNWSCQQSKNAKTLDFHEFFQLHNFHIFSRQNRYKIQLMVVIFKKPIFPLHWIQCALFEIRNWPISRWWLHRHWCRSTNSSVDCIDGLHIYFHQRGAGNEMIFCFCSIAILNISWCLSILMNEM